jgi:hypothetical protein
MLGMQWIKEYPGDKNVNATYKLLDRSLCSKESAVAILSIFSCDPEWTK